MQTTRPLLVLGTRPEAIKMAPIIHECQQRAEIAPIVCFTGQHREMVAQVAEYFGIRIEANVDRRCSRHSPNKGSAFHRLHSCGTSQRDPHVKHNHS